MASRKDKSMKLTGKKYCCVPDMILSGSLTKEFAMAALALIYDRRHKRKTAVRRNNV